jgi:hypothetical protein
MACPYFYPIVKAESSRQPARAPLGDVYQGRCDAGGGANTDACNSDACNFGYARGNCQAFPADSDIDAVRFSRIGEQTTFVLERDCFPVRHGDAQTLTGTLARQAEVFGAWAAK